MKFDFEIVVFKSSIDYAYGEWTLTLIPLGKWRKECKQKLAPIFVLVDCILNSTVLI
jgi:hypothetical protein